MNAVDSRLLCDGTKPERRRLEVLQAAINCLLKKNLNNLLFYGDPPGRKFVILAITPRQPYAGHAVIRPCGKHSTVV